jgi:hypothetical protein
MAGYGPDVPDDSGPGYGSAPAAGGTLAFAPSAPAMPSVTQYPSASRFRTGGCVPPWRRVAAP